MATTDETRCKDVSYHTKLDRLLHGLILLDARLEALEVVQEEIVEKLANLSPNYGEGFSIQDGE